GPGQRGQARGLRVPLVPAHQRADGTDARRHGDEAEVAGREVELLVVQRVVGDVHLAIAAGEPAVGIEDDGRVVVDARGAPLEDGADDDHARVARDAGERVGRRSGYGLGQVEECDVLALAEVLRAEELREADDTGAARGRLPDVGDGGRQVRRG